MATRRRSLAPEPFPCPPPIVHYIHYRQHPGIGSTQGRGYQGVLLHNLSAALNLRPLLARLEHYFSPFTPGGTCNSGTVSQVADVGGLSLDSKPCHVPGPRPHGKQSCLASVLHNINQPATHHSFDVNSVYRSIARCPTCQNDQLRREDSCHFLGILPRRD